MREQIAEWLYKRDEPYSDMKLQDSLVEGFKQRYYRDANQIHELYKQWFKEQIDKLEVIGDEGIKNILRTEYISGTDRVLLQAQLSHSKTKLYEVLE